MDIEKAKNRLTGRLRQWQDILAIEDEVERDIECTAYIEDMPFNEIKAVLLELDKKDKIIDEMIQEYEYNARINVKNFCDEEIRKDKCIQDCTNCIKEYFTNKAMSEKPTEGV